MSDRPDCPGEQTLHAFRAGRLDAAAARAVRVHLDGCAECRDWLREAEPLDPETEPTSEAVLTPPSAAPMAPTIPAGVVRPPDDTDPLLGVTCLRPSNNPEALGRIGSYDVMCVLGRGGMGVVLKAFDTSLHRTVAIKLLSPHLATSRKAHRRFLREARAAAGINHPNVVTIHAVEEQEGMPYLVMEYVPGQTLRQRIRAGGPFDLASLLRIGAQVAAGLAAAHRHGVIHRDIKPANIMLEDGIERAKITDFGLALVALDVAQLTSADNVLGTPAYMSPEQVAGRRVDPRADLFSLGCVLYAMVSGGSPFHGTHALDIARKVTDLVPPPLHELHPEIPRVISDAVARLLEKEPDQRYQSADQVHDVLVGYLARAQQGASLESISGKAHVPPVPRPSRRWPLAAAALALLALLVGAAFWMGRRDGPGSGGQDSSRPDALFQSPPKPGEVITVAQTGGAQFRDLREALARAGPGTTIRILDQGPYQGPFTLDDPERLHDVTIEATDHALLESVDAKTAVLSVENTPGVALRGLHVNARNHQFGIAVTGPCPGLSVEQLRLTQPPQSNHAAIVLWQGTTGSADRPIILRDLDVHCGTLGIVILGQANEPAAWIYVENNRFTGPGYQMTLENSVRDVHVSGNLFIQGKRGISLELSVPKQSQRLTIANNSFFRVPEWLGFTESSFDQADITIANNLIVQSKEIQLGRQDLTGVAGLWFRNNWWEPAPDADLRHVRLVAELKADMKLLSRDPASPDFLRPASDTMPPGTAVGPAPWAYIGARPPAAGAGPAKPSTKQP
jgi:serine/threonine protein kinase